MAFDKPDSDAKLTFGRYDRSVKANVLCLGTINNSVTQHRLCSIPWVPLRLQYVSKEM